MFVVTTEVEKTSINCRSLSYCFSQCKGEGFIIVELTKAEKNSTEAAICQVCCLLICRVCTESPGDIFS